MKAIITSCEAAIDTPSVVTLTIDNPDLTLRELRQMNEVGREVEFILGGDMPDVPTEPEKPKRGRPRKSAIAEPGPLPVAEAEKPEPEPEHKPEPVPSPDEIDAIFAGAEPAELAEAETEAEESPEPNDAEAVEAQQDNPSEDLALAQEAGTPADPLSDPPRADSSTAAAAAAETPESAKPVMPSIRVGSSLSETIRPGDEIIRRADQRQAGIPAKPIRILDVDHVGNVDPEKNPNGRTGVRTPNGWTSFDALDEKYEIHSYAGVV
jgi:hypothetical protein